MGPIRYPRMTRHPIAWTIVGANRNDIVVLVSTLDAAGLLADIGTMHLNPGYDSGVARQRLLEHGIDDFNIQLHGTKVPGLKTQPVPLGMRWVVEATNTWSVN